MNRLHLERQGPAGQYKVRKILEELESTGYLRRKKTKGDSGLFEWITEVYDSPGQTSGGFSTDGETTDGSSTDGESRDIVNTDVSITEGVSTEEETPVTSTKSPKKDRTKVDYTEDFEKAWKVYPKRDRGKAAGFKVWKTRLKDGWTAETLIKASQNYAKGCKQERTESRFMLHMATFYGPQLRFTDYVERPPSTRSNREVQSNRDEEGDVDPRDLYRKRKEEDES